MIYHVAQAAYLRVGLGNIEGLCEGVNVYPTCAYTRYSLMLKCQFSDLGVLLSRLTIGRSQVATGAHSIEKLNMKDSMWKWQQRKGEAHDACHQPQLPQPTA